MRYLALTLPLFVLLSFHYTSDEENVTPLPQLNLEQEETEKAMSVFLTALNTGDEKKEWFYRENEILWYNVNRNQTPDTITGSLAEVSFLHLASFPALDIHKDERRLYRIFYREELDSGQFQKHRYVFHINEKNKIDEILYLPPPREIKNVPFTEEEIELMRPMGCASVEPIYQKIELKELDKNGAPKKNKKLDD